MGKDAPESGGEEIRAVEVPIEKTNWTAVYLTIAICLGAPHLYEMYMIWRAPRLPLQPVREIAVYDRKGPLALIPASGPATMIETPVGEMWFNIDDEIVRIYDGNGWIRLEEKER